MMEISQKFLEAMKRKANTEQEMRDLSGGQNRAWLDLDPAQALELVAELERLQAENAALREDKSRLNEQLERVNFVAAARAKDLQALQDSREAALNTKPDAAPVEPAPAREIAVGDRVWFGGMEATVHTVPQDETGDYIIALFGVDATHYRHVPRSKIRPR